MDTPKFPKCNIFYATTPTGETGIPVLEINGHECPMAYIRDEKVPHFKALAADMAHKSDLTFHYVEYENPVHVEEIEPKDLSQELRELFDSLEHSFIGFLKEKQIH